MVELRRDTSPTYKTLKWLIYSMSIIGWYKDGFTKTRTKILQMLNIIICLLAPFSFAAIVVNLLLKSTINLAVNIVTLVNCVATVIFLILGNLYIPSRFNKLLIGCDDLKTKYGDTSPNSNIKTGFVICAATYLCICVLYWISVIYFSISYQSFNAIAGIPIAYTVFSLIVTFLYPIVDFFQRFVIMSMIHCICWIIRTEAAEISKQLKKMADTTPSESQLEEVKRRYIDVTDLIDSADNILSPFLSILLVLAFAFFCFLVNQLEMNKANQFTTFFIVVICNAFDITFLLTQGCLLHESISACIQIPLKFDGSQMTGKQVGQTIILLETMKNAENGISFLKMFILNKPAVLTVFGTLATYVIIVMQFQQV